MRKSNVGIDLDGVICDLYPSIRPLFKEMYNFDVTETCDNIESLGLTTEQCCSVFAEAGKRGIYRDAPVYPNTRKNLVNISRQYNIYYVTVRDFYKDIKKDTFYWLDRNKLPYYRVVFSRSKHKIAEAEAFQFFLDDSVEVCNRVAKSGVPTFMFKQPWNKESIKNGSLDPLVMILNSWEEVEQILLVP